MLAVAFALSASVAWGFADFLGGVESRRRPMLLVILVSQLAGLLGAGVLVLAMGGGVPTTPTVIAAAIAGTLGAASIAAFYRALVIGTISVVAPIVAVGAAVPVFAGILVGERPGVGQSMGLGIAILGVILAARESGTPAHGGRNQRLSIILAIATAVLLGLTLIAFERGAQHDVAWTILVARCVSFPIFVAAVLTLRPSLRMPKAALPTLIVIGLLDTGANALFAAAASLGYLSVVAVLASLYPVVTVALARLKLGERISASQKFGVTLAFAGVMLITVG
jgi:drug/metabolite transporter (DMT)-like permease